MTIKQPGGKKQKFRHDNRTPRPAASQLAEGEEPKLIKQGRTRWGRQ
jgi:hypothetical protein